MISAAAAPEIEPFAAALRLASAPTIAELRRDLATTGVMTLTPSGERVAPTPFPGP